VSPIPNTGNNSLYHRVNVEGTRNIIDAAISCNVRKLIFTSSAGVVFEGRDIADADEQTPYPRTALDVYTETKAEAEQLVIAANGKHGLLTVSLRPASIYG
jgi:sterol-4alpha-carboxylate 3-dehydrogenase (decarboxylating)